MFSDITSYFTSSSSQQDTRDDIELRKSWQIATSLADARTKKSAAESILQDKNMSRISPHDLCNLITRLLRSDESATDTHHNRELWKELPTYISILSAYPPNAELSSLPSEQATRIAANVTRAAALVKEKTEKYQAALCISLDHTTRGRFKAINSVDSESRRGQRIHTLMLTNLMFNDQALDALRRTLQNKQIVNLDLSNCFLGDHIVEGLLVNQLRGLPELAVLSLRANALTNDIVSLLITPRPASVTQHQQQQGDGDRKKKKKQQRQEHQQTMTTTTASDVFHSLSNENTSNQRNRNNNNNHSSSNSRNVHDNNNNSNCPAFLESSNDFISLRLLILDDNEISAHHLNQIRVTLMMRWKRFVSQYDHAVAMGLSSIESRESSSLSSLSNNHNEASPSSLPGANDPPSSSFMFHNNNNNINNNNTTTCVSFRHTNLPSIFLSLDGSGVAGIMQAQYLANTPLFASRLPECIVATSASLITACAIALSIPMTTVCATFRKLATEVFQRSEWDAKHYAESAAMWVRKWWTCGDYYSSSKTLTILQGLFGNQKFMDLPGSRVIAVFDSSKGHVMIASSTPASPALQTQCHTFSSKPFAVAQYCPTVAEVCLASMAGPGHFAPRALNVPSTRYLNSIDNNNNIQHQHQHQQHNSILDPSLLVDQVVVFDACGSMPNPSAIALTEAMRPSTKQRRLISISSESESGIASIPEHGVASIAASALSNWQNARVGLGNSELHGDFSNRCAAFVKLLKFGSYIARATSFSVQHIAESTEDNEAALREHLAVVSKKNNRDDDDDSSSDDETTNTKENTSRKSSFSDENKKNNKNNKSPGIHPVPVHQHPSSSLQQQQQHEHSKEDEIIKKDDSESENNNKNDDDNQQQQEQQRQDEESTSRILRPVATEEEMKSISKLMLQENNNNDNGNVHAVEDETNQNNTMIGHHQKNNSDETDDEQDPFDFDAETDEKNKENKKKNKIRNSTTKNNTNANHDSNHNNFVSTAILYERIFPCTNDAPSIHYDENSMRILSVAQKQATYYQHNHNENGLVFDDDDREEEEREREQLRQPNRYYATTGVDSDNNNGAAAASSSFVIRGGRRS